MHEAVVRSKVRFKENRFPYIPHCTLKAGDPKESDREFIDMYFPRLAFIDCFSLYQPEPNGGQRIYRFEQTASHNERQAPA